MPPSWQIRGPVLLGCVVFVGCVGVALNAALNVADGHLIYALDDAYIHMAMAKNFATHGVWGCTPYHFSSSSSSLLWTLVLAVAYLAAGVRDLTPLVLNLVFGVLTLAVSDYYLRRFAVPPLVRGAGLIGIVIAAALPAMVLMGMEHPLHLCLTIWFAGASVQALARADSEQPRRTRQTIALCALAALLATSRYEGYFLVGLVCLTFAARKELGRAILIGTSALLPAIVYGVISLANGALFFPNSLMLKAGGTSVSAFSVLLKPIGSEDLAFYQNNPALIILVSLGGLAALVHAVARRHLWHARVLLPVWLVLMIVLHGHFVFSSTYWAYRYDAYLLGFGVFAAAVVLEIPGASRQRPVRLLPALLATAGVAALITSIANVKEALYPQADLALVRNTYVEHYETAQFVKTYYPNSVVAVNDLGAVTYFTEARVLDLVGLGDIEPLLIARRTGGYTREDVHAWTGRHHPRIAIIQLNWSWIVPRVPPQWIKVAEVAIPPNGQKVGFFAVAPDAADLLRADVDHHYRWRRAGVGYQVRLF